MEHLSHCERRSLSHVILVSGIVSYITCCRAMHPLSAPLRSLPVRRLLRQEDHHVDHLAQQAHNLYERVAGKATFSGIDEEDDVTAADHVMQEAWNRVHHSTHDSLTRYAYAVAAVCKAIILIQGADENPCALKDALIALDLALIMSPPLDGPVVSRVAEQVHRVLPVSCLKSGTVSSSISLPVHKQVPIEENLDLVRFEVDYFRKHVPVVIRNAVHHWPALDPESGRKWSLQYLNQKIGHRTVPVEIGTKYTDQCWSQRLMTVNEFMNDYVIENVAQTGSKEKGYLAQHDLFHQIPELRKDICIPDFCSVRIDDDVNPDDSSGQGEGEAIETNVWFGPSGTVSPLHFDPKHNILVQVSGSKYIRIYDSKTPADIIYPHAQDSLLRNTSRVDVEDVDEERFPEFPRRASNFMWETIVQDGDAIFIPRHAWHFVKSLTISCSISFWWN